MGRMIRKVKRAVRQRANRQLHEVLAHAFRMPWRDRLRLCWWIMRKRAAKGTKLVAEVER